MKMIEKTIPSRADGLQLSVLMIQPEGILKGAVQILHGMSEYKERYLPVMEFLATHGYASVIHDHRGHGKSVKSESDYGYMYEVGYEGFLDDVLLVNEFVHEQFPDIPLILFGHSMGTLAARAFLREHDDCVDKVILSGPPCKNSVVDMGLLIAKLQKSVRGSRCPAKLLDSMSIGTYQKAFKEEGITAWLCSDSKMAKIYEQDSRCGFLFTVDGYLVLLRLLKYSYQEKGWSCKYTDLPIMFLGGADDPCIGGKEKFEEEMAVMKKVGYQAVSGKLYDGMRHEICNEIGKEQVLEDILGFLEGNKK